MHCNATSPRLAGLTRLFVSIRTAKAGISPQSNGLDWLSDEHKVENKYKEYMRKDVGTAGLPDQPDSYEQVVMLIIKFNGD